MAASYVNDNNVFYFDATTQGVGRDISGTEFDFDLYIKNIVIVGDGTNEGAVTIVDAASSGKPVAKGYVTQENVTVVVPIYGRVKALYVSALATGAVVYAYHGYV